MLYAIIIYFVNVMMIHQSILYLIVASAASINAFVLQTSRARNELRILKDRHSFGRDLQDIDSARQVFEDLFDEDSFKGQVFVSDASIITSVSRSRREIEMKLLESLKDSDDAIEELMHLWITERGDESATRIMEMQEECSVGLLEEEVSLRRMIQKHPRWAEPAIRLAALLFFKGITEESYQLAMYAMHLKPWHIEVPQLLVLLALREQDMAKAIYWARRGLPALSNTNRRRKEWVELALKQAREQNDDAERQREEYIQRMRSIESLETNMEHQAWE